VAVGEVGGHAVVVSGSEDTTIRLWNAHTGAPIGQPLGHTDWVTAVALGAVDGHALVVSGEGWDIRLWDARAEAPVGQPLEGHTGGVTAVAFGTIDGRAVVVSGSHDQTIRLWDARTHLEEVVVSLGLRILSIAHQPDAAIAVGTEAGLLVFEFRQDDEIMKGEADGPTAVAFGIYEVAERARTAQEFYSKLHEAVHEARPDDEDSTFADASKPKKVVHLH